MQNGGNGEKIFFLPNRKKHELVGWRAQKVGKMCRRRRNRAQKPEKCAEEGENARRRSENLYCQFLQPAVAQNDRNCHIQIIDNPPKCDKI